jgi:hypothetical protein
VPKAHTYLSGACSISFRCVHPFTGKAACSLWCGYCIVYCAIPDRDPSFVNTTLLISGTLSLFQSGVWHIHDHGTPLRCTSTAIRICVSCSGSASCYATHVPHIQEHCICTTCLYTHLPQFPLFVFVAAMWVHLIHIAMFVPHITSMCIICTAATANSYFIVYHLWWSVFSGMVIAEGSFT